MRQHDYFPGSVILSAPKSWVAKQNIEELRKFYGSVYVVENWQPHMDTIDGALHLTSFRITNSDALAVTMRRFRYKIVAKGWPHSGGRMNVKINSEGTVAVDQNYYWDEDMSQCPRNVKCQLLSIGGVASYATYNGKDPFWIAWAPLPKRRPAAPARPRPHDGLQAP